MRTRSQKKKLKKDREGRNNFDGIPLDLVIEIIGRLPVKSVARFLLLSKLWARTIRSRDFITSFPFGSSSQPRLLVAFSDLDTQTRRHKWYFYSSSSSSSMSLLSRVTFPFPVTDYQRRDSRHVNGLLNLGHDQEKVITNPSTGRSIILPKVKTRRIFLLSFFGYDSANDQYKVLCMTRKLHSEETSSQHQVFTLGAKSWRIIECSIPHFPSSASVCIESVLYYLAYTGTDLRQLSLMSFDLRSEKFILFTSLHIDTGALYVYGYDLINYQGKVAIGVSTRTTEYRYDVWVMDQNAENHELLKKVSFDIGHLKSTTCLFMLNSFRIIGTNHMGEFILAPSYYFDGFYVLLYNPDKNIFRNFKIEVNEDYGFKRGSTRAMVFSDYVESVRLL